MKIKLSIKIIPLVFIALFFAASSVKASGLLFYESKMEIEEGQIFKGILIIDPLKEKNYTAVIKISYSPEILEFLSFDLAKEWIPVDSPDFNYIDAKKGEIKKTAGFGGGFSKKTVFGTISFRAKKSGRALVEAGESSFVFDDKNNNTLSGSSYLEVNISRKDVYNGMPLNFLFKNYLQFGDTGSEVANLQFCLLSKNFYFGEISGRYDLLTIKAVSRFQEEYFKNFSDQKEIAKEKGRIGKNTLDKMNDICFPGRVKRPEKKNITIEEKDDVFKIEEINLPEKIFNISMDLDLRLLRDAGELAPSVIFTSFSRITTPIDMVFTIMDSRGNKVAEERNQTVAQTEKTFNKRFPDLSLPPGKYLLILKTSYNAGVEDEAGADFVVMEKTEELDSFFDILGSAGLVLTIIMAILFLIKAFWGDKEIWRKKISFKTRLISKFFRK